MDCPKYIISNQKEEPISIQKVYTCLQMMLVKFSYQLFCCCLFYRQKVREQIEKDKKERALKVRLFSLQEPAPEILALTVKPVLRGHSKRRPKLVFNTDYRLMQVKSIAECFKGSILQYFRP